LDAHVLQSPSDGSGQPVPALRLAVKAFRAPAMALVETGVLFRPTLLAPTGAQQRGVIVAHHYGLVDAAGGQAVAPHRTTPTVAGARVEEAAMRNPPLRTQNATLWAFQDVVFGVVADPAQRHATSDRLLLGRNHRVNASAFEPAIHLAVGVA